MYGQQTLSRPLELLDFDFKGLAIMQGYNKNSYKARVKSVL